MRVLLTSTQGAGHFLPLVPFGRAVERLGGEVLVAGPPPVAPLVEAAGFVFASFDPPPEDVLRTVWDRVPSLPEEEREAVVVGDIFGRLDGGAALPGVRATCETFRPDLVLREQNEYGGLLAAELLGIPQARVAIGLSSAETACILHAAPALDDLRRGVGLPADPAGERIRRSPFVSLFPEAFEDPAVPAQPRTLRARDPAWDDTPVALPDWWQGSADPLLYVTFGSVAGAIPQMRGIYDLTLTVVGDLPARVLLTVGHAMEDFDAVPDNVHVEAWVPQQQALAAASAVVCHGGSGSTLGALAAGVPLVVVPLFADQPLNAARVAAVGAGRVVEPPRPESLRAAIEDVLADGALRDAARRIAADLRTVPPVDAVLEDVLAAAV